MKRSNVLFALASAIMYCGSMSAQSSLSLHYNEPATFFEEALVIGNGSQGAIVYGGTHEEKISLNDMTLWTGEPDLKVWNPDAYKSIPEIRKALANEDYRLADKLQRKDQGHYSQSYQPIGTLTMTDMDHEVTSTSNYARSLDIEKAIADVAYSNRKGSFTRQYFASAPDSVIIIRLKAENGAKINRSFRMHCQLPNMTFIEKGELVMDGYAAYSNLPSYTDAAIKHRYDSNRGVHFRACVHIINKDGEVISNYNDQLNLINCTDATIIIAIATSFNGLDKDPVKEGKNYQALVRSRIDNAVSKSYEELLKRHTDDYTALFSRFSIDLGKTDPKIAALPTDKQLLEYTLAYEDAVSKKLPLWRDGDSASFNPDLEELYMQYGRYLLISSSRTDMVPANLQGIWNESILPPWSCNYTSNINLEENYWPAEIANLSELHKPMLDFIEKLPVTGEKTAKAYYNVNEGWCLAHNTDIWGMTCPVGEGDGDPNWANWNMGGAWVSTHIWEHYLFSMDKEYLRKAYPTLKGAADFCMSWLISLKDLKNMSDNPDGSLHLGGDVRKDREGLDYLLTAPSTSPENTYMTPDGYDGRTMYGGSADLAMIRECLLDTRAATVALGGDKAYIKKIDNTLARILPYMIGKDGSLQEWFHDWKDTDPQHRHQSHLFGLFPGHHISVSKTPELAQACKRALEIKGDKTTGWSTGWRVNLQARLHESEAAYHIYRTLLKYISPDKYQGPDRRKGGGTYPNLLDAHSPFQIDGNFGGTAGVIEMLCQSDENEIELLPALPEAWKKEGSVSGICCRGGFEISFTWKNGNVTSVSILSKRSDNAKANITLPNGKKIVVSLKAGNKKSIKTA